MGTLAVSSTRLRTCEYGFIVVGFGAELWAQLMKEGEGERERERARERERSLSIDD
jgi:hypothetical protein